MNDTQYAHLRDLFEDTFNTWLERFRLSAWRGEIRYHRGDAHPTRPSVQASTDAQWAYLFYGIDVYLETVLAAIVAGEDEREVVAGVVVHELLHVVQSPYLQVLPESHHDALEHVTSHLSHAFERLGRDLELPVLARPVESHGFRLCDRCPHGRHDGICGQPVEPGAPGCPCNRNPEVRA